MKKLSIYGIFASTDHHLAELFSQHGADFGPHLLSNAGTPQVIAKRIVDQGLIVAAIRLANLVAEVIDDISVHANRDTNLLRRQRNDRPALSLAEVVLALHMFPPAIPTLFSTSNAA